MSKTKVVSAEELRARVRAEALEHIAEHGMVEQSIAKGMLLEYWAMECYEQDYPEYKQEVIRSAERKFGHVFAVAVSERSEEITEDDFFDYEEPSFVKLEIAEICAGL